MKIKLKISDDLYSKLKDDDKEVIDKYLKELTEIFNRELSENIRVFLENCGVYGCGGCHQWGCNPVLKDGVCNACKRTEEQIKKDHGFFNILELDCDA